MGYHCRDRKKEMREMECYCWEKDKKGHCCCDHCKKDKKEHYWYDDCKKDKKGHCFCDKWKDKHHDKKDHHKKDDRKKDMADLRDFEFFTLDPNVQEPNRFELPANQQFPAASVTLDKVKKGDVAWLNGVFGLDNDAAVFRTVIMRIFKGTPPVLIPGQEIYRAVIEIDDEGNDDQVVEPLAHVDVIMQKDQDVTYTVTLEADGDDVFLNGPITFTAALINK